MFYFIVVISLVLFATLLETLILAGNDWKTTKFTPMYKFVVNVAYINSFCEAFWHVVLLYTLTITVFIIAGAYCYGWYHIFTDVSSKFVDFTIAFSTVSAVIMFFINAPIIINKIKKLFFNKSKDESKPLKIVVSIKNIHSKFKDKYCPTIK